MRGLFRGLSMLCGGLLLGEIFTTQFSLADALNSQADADALSIQADKSDDLEFVAGLAEGFVGVFGKFGIDLEEDSLSVYTCGEQGDASSVYRKFNIHPGDYKKIERAASGDTIGLQEGARDIFNVDVRISNVDTAFSRRADMFSTVAMVGRRTNIKGIESIELFVPISSWLRKHGVARLVGSLSHRDAVGFSSFMRCPSLGFEPGAVAVIMNPGALDHLKIISKIELKNLNILQKLTLLKDTKKKRLRIRM